MSDAPQESILPPQMVQEIFFSCVESLVKQQQRRNNQVRPNDERDKLKQGQAERMVHEAIDEAVSRGSMHEVV